MDRRTALKQLSNIIGGTIALPIASGFLAGCAPSENKARWQPRTLSKFENELVTAISELIIPQTDTPGAKAARVNEFIDLLLSDWFSDSEKSNFFAGMESAMAYCKEKNKKEFLDCSIKEQSNLLLDLENEFINATGEKSSRSEFFSTVKQFTVLGYYTSEIGATQELRLPPMGQYLGCDPYDNNAPAWAW